MAINLVHDPLAIIPHISHLRMATLVQPDYCLLPPSSKGPLSAMALRYYDSGKGGQPIPRPFLGGPKVGFHAMPALGDDVLVCYEPKLHPVGAISVTNSPQLLDVLQPGESMQRAVDGRQANFLKADGSSAMFTDKNSVLLFNIDTSSNISLGSSGTTVTISSPLSLSGQTVATNQAKTGTATGTCPSGGGAMTGGACSITFPRTVTITINGNSYVIPSLT